MRKARAPAVNIVLHRLVAPPSRLGQPLPLPTTSSVLLLSPNITSPMPIEFRRHTLPNGLTIIAEVDPAAHSAAAGFFVKTGARDEATHVMGVSHFLEHMMFKGTADIPAEELNRRFDEMGARNNAFTSNEMTCFYAHLLPEFLDAGVELLARMMRPALRESDFSTEKGVILEEIAMYKDQPFWVLYEACTEKHFGAHPLSHRVLGTPDSITALTASQMRDYFETRYAADNTILALAGRLDFARVIDLAEKWCGSWQPTRVGRDSSLPRIAGGRLELQDEKVSRAYLLALCDGPSYADDRRYASALLAQVLGASDNSLLHWALIEPGLAEEAQASFSPHDGFGEFFIFASGDPHRAQAIWDAIAAQLSRLVDSITEDDLVRLKAKIATGATLGAERPADRMHRLGHNWVYLADYRPIEDELAKIERLTRKDLQDAAKAFPIHAQTFGLLTPK